MECSVKHRSAGGLGAYIAAAVYGLVSACGPAESVDEAAEAPVGVVDSILPIEEEMRRFREVLGPEPDGLTGGAPSRDALVARFAAAIVASDTAAFADMLMTLDEFGWLYYPHSRFTAPPYELPPGLVWFQIENGSGSGIGRLFERHVGRPFTLLGYSCDPEPVVEERNRVWERCDVRFDTPDDKPRDLQLFGSILERGGVFKFMSYANGY
jgi:hypothetical protein